MLRTFFHSVICWLRAPRKRADAAEWESERLRLAVQSGAIGAIEIDFVSGQVTLSEKWREIWGIDVTEPVTINSLNAMVVVDDRPVRTAAQAQSLDPRGPGLFQARFRIRRRNDGALRWVSSRGQVHFEKGVAIRLLGVTRDVTDEIEAATALEEKARLAEQLTMLAGALPGAVYTFVLRPDGSGYLPYAAPHIENLLGLSPEDCRRDVRAVAERVHPDDLAEIWDTIAECSRTKALWRAKFRYNHPEKGEICLEAHSRPAPQDDGGAVWHGYLQDVTAREAASRALDESEARVRALKDAQLAALEDKARLAEQLTMLAGALPGAIYTFSRRPDGSSYFPYAAPHVEALLGFGPDTYKRDLGALAERVHPEDLPGLLETIAECARTKALWRAEFRYNHPEKGEIWLEGHSQPARREDGGFVWHGYLQDVTSRVAANRALDESEALVRALKDERLAALEKMAARLAHEVNQPLAAGATLLAVARRRLQSPSLRQTRNGDLTKAADALEKAADQVLRAGRIISRVRDFSRSGEPNKTFRSLHDTIRETLAGLEADSIFADLEIAVRLEADRDLVLIDRVQIMEVLVNLLQNARQAALPEARPNIEIASRNSEENIEISVIDYGAGLSEDARRHLFELFWTSKSSGMGVGLALSRAIVEAHSGRLWAPDSQPGKTVFTFSLPLVERTEVSERAE